MNTWYLLEYYSNTDIYTSMNILSYHKFVCVCECVCVRDRDKRMSEYLFHELELDSSSDGLRASVEITSESWDDMSACEGGGRDVMLINIEPPTTHTRTHTRSLTHSHHYHHTHTHTLSHTTTTTLIHSLTHSLTPPHSLTHSFANTTTTLTHSLIHAHSLAHSPKLARGCLSFFTRRSLFLFFLHL